MSQGRFVLCLFALMLGAVACAPKEEPPLPVAGPVQPEPIFSGKYR